MHAKLGTAILAVAVLVPAADAGEISGLPPHLVPTSRPEFTLFLGNDFLAPGTNDDFRTQQNIVTGRIGDRWLAVLDHSILTRADAVTGPPARVDQMSVSLGREWLRQETPDGRTTLTAGLGLRGVGDYEGARIQNGFHALIASGTSFLPYAATRQVDATIWGLAENYRLVRRASGAGLLSGWDTGYWLRSGALATADGQFDGMLGLYAIAARPGFDAWIGLRRDFREGYDADVVQRETADAERKTALSWGVRMGSLVIETVQRFGSSASYGQVSFVSSAATRRQPTAGAAAADLQLGLHMPHMLLQASGRWHRPLLLDGASAWRESLLIDLRGGQPQIGRDVNRFAATGQLTAGLEWSRGIGPAREWLRFYGAVTAGWRQERFTGRGALDGVTSASVGRPVIAADLGIEVDAIRLGGAWRHKLRLGLSAWAPLDTVVVTAAGETVRLLEPGAALAVGWTFNRY